MRSNLPVTQNEYSIPADETLLSVTDVASHITYANAAFIRASGYAFDELTGQPHNLVRHPDMPAEAFADMWRSLKAGYSWTALVKNRRKNGDHYWVRANAAPMRRNGQLTGYLSVRTKPSRAEIEAAQALYSRFTQGHAKGVDFHRGLVVRTGWLCWTNALKVLPTAWRIRVPFMALTALLAVLLVFGGLTGGALTASAALAGLGVVLANWTVEVQVSRPLRAIMEAAQRVASGEAGEQLELDRCDDLGLIARAVNQAGLNLASLVADVHEQIHGVQTASKEIAAANHDLSSRTEQTAANLQQTTAAMEQQTAIVRQNSDIAQQASRRAGVATEVAVKGGEAVAHVVATMADISKASHKIADIIGVIDSIAFQTNILALNAAVEAARAGDQGRGFAVVAGEVRQLAGRSSTAAKEIKDLISASMDKVSSGLSRVADAGKTMSDVVQQVRHVNEMILGMSTASEAQAAGISQVGQAVAQLDQLTQQNAAMVEQSSAAANTMRDQAQRLMEAIKVFSSPAPETPSLQGGAYAPLLVAIAAGHASDARFN